MKQVLDQSQDKSLLLFLEIEWHEGGPSEFNGQKFMTWTDVQNAFNALYSDYVASGALGYYKCKVRALWNNGRYLVDRIDVGNHGSDYSPERETVGQYLQRQKSAFYDSNLQVGDRQNILSFHDDGECIKQPPLKQTILLELSNFAVNEHGKIIKNC